MASLSLSSFPSTPSWPFTHLETYSTILSLIIVGSWCGKVRWRSVFTTSDTAHPTPFVAKFPFLPLPYTRLANSVPVYNPPSPGLGQAGEYRVQLFILFPSACICFKPVTLRVRELLKVSREGVLAGMQVPSGCERRVEKSCIMHHAQLEIHNEVK